MSQPNRLVDLLVIIASKPLHLPPISSITLQCFAVIGCLLIWFSLNSDLFLHLEKISVYVRPKCRRYGVKHQIINQSRKEKKNNLKTFASREIRWKTHLIYIPVYLILTCLCYNDFISILSELKLSVRPHVLGLQTYLL